jgi:hypothetical protein
MPSPTMLRRPCFAAIYQVLYEVFAARALHLDHRSLNVGKRLGFHGSTAPCSPFNNRRLRGTLSTVVLRWRKGAAGLTVFTTPNTRQTRRKRHHRHPPYASYSTITSKIPLLCQANGRNRRRNIFGSILVTWLGAGEVVMARPRYASSSDPRRAIAGWFTSGCFQIV